MRKNALVVSAHSADFIWRAGGAIALHAERGMQLTVVALSFGERGESARLWRQPGMTIDQVKALRRAEAEAAAKVLGVHDLQFWDCGDCPLVLDTGAMDRMAALFRRLRPKFVITHGPVDRHNPDHAAASTFVQQARVVAQAHGYEPDVPAIGAPAVYLFEPQQPEICGWVPSLLLDIGPVWTKKLAAIECMVGQEHLWAYYTRVAQQRGAQAARNSDRAVAWGEAYMTVFPGVVDTLT